MSQPGSKSLSLWQDISRLIIRKGELQWHLCLVTQPDAVSRMGWHLPLLFQKPTLCYGNDLIFYCLPICPGWSFPLGRYSWSNLAVWRRFEWKVISLTILQEAFEPRGFSLANKTCLFSWLLSQHNASSWNVYLCRDLSHWNVSLSPGYGQGT